MKAITRPAVAILLLLFTLTATTAAQQRRQTAAKPQPKPAAAPTPAPTFETLVPADSYIIYGELRGAGQFIRSSALNDLLEPVLKLSGPPKEFRAVVRWLNAHAEEVMTSRLLLATWPNNNAKHLPEALVAIEFASAEEATKFTVTLNEFLPTVLPPRPPEPPEEGSPRPDATEKPKPPVPSFHLNRFGSLVVISPKPWTMKQLRPAGSKLLSEDTNFRTAHNRFNAEPLFVYVDTKTISREEEENQKRWEKERIEAEKAEAEAKLKKAEEGREEEGEKEAAADNFTLTEEVKDMSALPPPLKEEPAPPDPLSSLLSGFGSYFFDTSESTWPEGIAFALSYEGDSFDLRALLVNQSGNKADALPFMPMLVTGPALTPEAAGILPADTELLATMSLDLPQIYTTMAKPRPKEKYITTRGSTQLKVDETDLEYPFAELEKQLKINIKNDLLPLLGPEIAIRLPMQNMNFIGLPGMAPSTPAVKEPTATNGPVLAIAIKDREAMKALMPKIIEAFGMKGASALAQTERREDTELVSFANMFAYAFVGNFLVISGDAANTRYVVDSYLKHETLSANIQFRNSTRWQPKPLQGQLYISPALMEGYKSWAEQPTTRISDQTRAFLVRASSMAQPITYSLSNEGLGPLHELHIPKNLVLMAVAGISGESNPPQNLQNERMAIGLMYTIGRAEQEYLKTKGSGATLEQLIEAEMVSKEMIENSGYRFELTLSGDKFEVSGVPLEYGKSGNLSLFIDQTFILRAADRNGAAATVSDPPLGR
jgi:hypothetical protein